MKQGCLFDCMVQGTIVPERHIRAIDLFCGAGGLTHGLARAGIDVRLGVDIDPACVFPYENNNGAALLLESVETLDARALAPHFGKTGLKLLAGCAPCQRFIMPRPLYCLGMDSPDQRIHKCPPGKSRKNIRSKTPRGFAEAVFACNARK